MKESSGERGFGIVSDYGNWAWGLMTVPNLVAVLLLAPKMANRTRHYFDRMAGES